MMISNNNNNNNNNNNTTITTTGKRKSEGEEEGGFPKRQKTTGRIWMQWAMSRLRDDQIDDEEKRLAKIINTEELAEALHQHHHSILSKEECKQIVVEYVRFLMIKKRADEKQEEVSPSPKVDLAWHLHILRTAQYHVN